MLVQKSMEKDLIALQELISHQSDDIARLSDELYAQQKEVAQLKSDLVQLKAEVASAKDQSDSEMSPDDQPPPHY